MIANLNGKKLWVEGSTAISIEELESEYQKATTDKESYEAELASLDNQITELTDKRVSVKESLKNATIELSKLTAILTKVRREEAKTESISEEAAPIVVEESTEKATASNAPTESSTVDSQEVTPVDEGPVTIQSNATSVNTKSSRRSLITSKRGSRRIIL